MRSIGKLFAIAIIRVLVVNSVNATPETTCKAAANADKRVNYHFCVHQLLGHHDSTEADTWGLVQIIALVGANNAGKTVDDINALLAKPSTGDEMKVVLGQCQNLYNRTVIAFAIAHDEINMRNYAAGKEKTSETIVLVHQCDNAFVKARVPSPLTKQSIDSVQLAVICTAITNLIKP